MKTISGNKPTAISEMRFGIYRSEPMDVSCTWWVDTAISYRQFHVKLDDGLKTLQVRITIGPEIKSAEFGETFREGGLESLVDKFIANETDFEKKEMVSFFLEALEFMGNESAMKKFQAHLLSRELES